MIASAHFANVGVRSALRALRRAPSPASTPGLRSSDTGLAAPLGGTPFPTPSLRRVGMVAFWDDDAALDRFLVDDPFAALLADGWSVRLEPLRAFGSWPGLDETVARSRTVQHEGPAAVLTLGRFRWRRAISFFRTSSKAERAVRHAPGLLWASGLGNPPFVATCSLWESAGALSAYAYGERDAPHPAAIAADRAKPFHHRSAFIRFRPYGSQGALDGKNPLMEAWMS